MGHPIIRRNDRHLSRPIYLLIAVPSAVPSFRLVLGKPVSGLKSAGPHGRFQSFGAAGSVSYLLQ